MELRQAVFETEFGWMGFVLSEDGLRRVIMPRDSDLEVRRELEDLGAVLPADGSLAEPLIALFEAFCAGRPVDFSGVAVDMDGWPPFWRRVWSVVRTIPYGETLSYGEVAEKAGRPLAARAAGQAMAHNPLAFVVPCHRVIAAGGRIGGYGGNERFKAELLRREGAWP